MVDSEVGAETGGLTEGEDGADSWGNVRVEVESKSESEFEFEFESGAELEFVSDLKSEGELLGETSGRAAEGGSGEEVSRGDSSAVDSPADLLTVSLVKGSSEVCRGFSGGFTAEVCKVVSVEALG